MCESEYSCQRPATIPWNWSYRDCELTKTAFCNSRALFLLRHSSPAPLTLKPPLTALLPFRAQTANYRLCCHFFFPSPHRPTTLGQAQFCHHSTQMTQG